MLIRDKNILWKYKIHMHNMLLPYVLVKPKYMDTCVVNLWDTCGSTFELMYGHTPRYICHMYWSKSSSYGVLSMCGLRHNDGPNFRAHVRSNFETHRLKHHGAPISRPMCGQYPRPIDEQILGIHVNVMCTCSLLKIVCCNQ